MTECNSDIMVSHHHLHHATDGSAQDSTAASAKSGIDLATPCCGVVRIDTKARLVTARETASGYTFQFKVSNRRLLASIKVGHKVWADFVAKKVWVKPEEACCDIVPSPAVPNPELRAPIQPELT